jgi:hypothetical protein
MTDPLPEPQARPPAAGRVCNRELRTTGAAQPLVRPRSPEVATGRLTTPTAPTHSSPGFRREAAAGTKGMARPEAAASLLITFVETTGVGSLAEAGEGPGAAGEHQLYDVPTHPISIWNSKKSCHLTKIVFRIFYFIDVLL